MKKHKLLWIGCLLPLLLQAQNLQQVDKDSLLSLFKAKDKPRIINFWATWCKPCVEEMPYFHRADSLLNQNGTKLEFVFVSFDRMRDTARVKQKIESAGIPGKHYIVSSQDAGLLIDAVDTAWGGSLPATWFVFEQLKFAHLDAFEQFDDLMRFIDAILNQEE